jgi:hypothetical protein
MKKILRVMAIVVLALSLGTAAASAQTGTIDNTGPDSVNKIKFSNRHDTDLNNRTKIRVRNDNPQVAQSGDVSVNHNTTGGGAASGAAANDGLLRVAGAVDNTGSSAAALANGEGEGDPEGTVTNTGPDSINKIKFENKNYVDVANKTRIDVRNNNDQYAKSGDVCVEDNTTAGDATSGDASNISTVDLNFTVTN